MLLKVFLALAAPAQPNYDCRDIDNQRVEFDRRCARDPELIGCDAGGQGLHCRFCGHGLYPACPGANEIERNPLADSAQIDFIEGDILLINTTADEYFQRFDASNKELGILIDNQFDEANKEIFQNALRNRRQLWPSGIVPFEISTSFDQDERNTIYKAMSTLEKYTCLNFVPRNKHEDYVSIYRGAGCFSYVGRFGGYQPLSLGWGCVFKGTVMHELLHAVGFHHEQSRADRDSYVRVQYENIQKNSEGNFRKYTLQKIDHLNEPYDYSSLMHYTSTAFSIDGVRKTIVPLQRGVELIHSARKYVPSQIDSNKVNKLYQCSPTTVTTTTTSAPPPAKPDPWKPTSGCVDANSNCRAWHKAGHCNSNVDYMKLACAKTCNLCHLVPDLGKCKDHVPYCRDWVDLDGCSKSPDYMRLACPRTCNYCSATCAGYQYTPEQTNLLPEVELRRPQRDIPEPPRAPALPKPAHGPE